MAHRRHCSRIAKGTDAALRASLSTRSAPKPSIAAKTSTLPEELLALGRYAVEQYHRLLPCTLPQPNLLFGLREALCMLEEEGLENVFRRHLRLAEATRRAVGAWGLELLAANPSEYSPP
jgi:alanine-glyoxylate transaminase/serine-glyoxylate transaminase/serine-pyruvate transaminase